MAEIAEWAKNATRQATCQAEGCGADMSQRRGRYCSKHSSRLARTGRLDRTDPVYAPSISHPNGYVLIYAPDHPVAVNTKRARIYEHRVMLYDTIGPGSHPCHHCGITVTWHVDLHTDHLDADKLNNDPANLVASCGNCNAWRARYPDSFAKHLPARRLAVTAMRQNGNQREAS